MLSHQQVSQMESLSNKRPRTLAPMNRFETTAMPTNNTGTGPGSPQRNSMIAHIQPTQQLDTRQRHQRQQSQSSQQQVGIPTNPGQFLQHYLQVAQHKDLARPGHTYEIPSTERISEDEYRRRQHSILERQLDMQLGRSSSPVMPPRPEDADLKMQRSRSSPESFNLVSGDQTHTIQGGWVSLNGQMVFVPAQQPKIAPVSQRPSSSHAHFMTGQVPMPSYTIDPPMHEPRPFTPPNQKCSSTPPVTPDQRPVNSSRQDRKRGQHAANATNALIQAQASCQDDCGDAMDLSKTIRMPAQAQLHGALFDNMFQDPAFDHAEQSLPSPPQTISLKAGRKFDVAKMPNSTDLEGLSRLMCGTENGKPLLDILECSPLILDNLDSLVNLPPSPHASVSHARNHSQALSERSFYTGYGSGSQNGGHSPSADYETPFGSPTKEDLEMEDFDMENAVNDTGISLEEVNQYISAQDPDTLKYTCMFEGCGRIFGRKENIRSHVQTHLGDRQFKCPHCSKDFVRQHDLKRHAKIHSGVKPYPCPCGNTFARHDALTRHRQRGICSGGFAGVVKKNAKRGRPRKDRMTDEKLDKAMKTRKLVADKANASSGSVTSDSSYMYTPEFAMLDNFSSSQTSRQMDSSVMRNSDSQFFDPQVFASYTPPHSPYTTHPLGSPKKISPSPANAPSPPAEDSDEMRLLRALNGFEAASSPSEYYAGGSHDGSQVGTPPSLSQSSRPGSSHGGDDSAGNKTMQTSTSSIKTVSTTGAVMQRQMTVAKFEDASSLASGLPTLDDMQQPSYFETMMEDEFLDLAQDQYNSKSAFRFPDPSFDDQELFE